MQSNVIEIVSSLGIGAALGSVVTYLVKERLSRQAEGRRRRIETDRATYGERMTRLIAANLCALIRSDRYRDGEREELADLVQHLSDGAHQQGFLDPTVQAAWAVLVKKSAEYGWRRLGGVITDKEIADYTQAWEAWMVASSESFGPLPEADRPQLRRRGNERSLKKAA